MIEGGKGRCRNKKEILEERKERKGKEGDERREESIMNGQENGWDGGKGEGVKGGRNGEKKLY